MCHIKRYILPLCSLILLSCMVSCFTGVEGTSKINLSKKDIVASAPTAEDRLLADVSSSPLRDWNQGKTFKVADEKFLLIVERSASRHLKLGDTIVYDHASIRSAPDGGEVTLIVFKDREGDAINYVIEKPLEEALVKFRASEMPMLVDLELVNTVRALLRGKKLWTRTALWYDDATHDKRGRKFTAVTIDDVVPGSAFFPLRIEFSDVNGDRGALLMNIGSSGNESRNFGKLFSLSDPRQQYKGISTENWAAIQSEELRLGMTKEECRLSRGNPIDVNTGHNYSNAVEIWYYQDGSYAQFVDGLLVAFK